MKFDAYSYISAILNLIILINFAATTMYIYIQFLQGPSVIDKWL